MALVLDKYKGHPVLQIWEPKYTTDSVLLATYKVNKSGDTYITFTHDTRLSGRLFKVAKEDVLTAPTKSNGKITCYNIPMSKLKEVELPLNLMPPTEIYARLSEEQKKGLFEILALEYTTNKQSPPEFPVEREVEMEDFELS